MSAQQITHDDDWPAFVCQYCDEVIEQPTTFEVFMHRSRCEKSDIAIKRLNAQHQIAGFTSTIEDLGNWQKWLRTIDRMDPDEAGSLAEYLDATLSKGEYSPTMQLSNLELQLWAYRRRATGAKVFPYRKG